MSERRESSGVIGKEDKIKMVKLHGPSCSSDAKDEKNGSSAIVAAVDEEIFCKPLKNRDSFRELQCDDDKTSNSRRKISNSRHSSKGDDTKEEVEEKCSRNVGCSSGSTSIASSSHEQCCSGSLPPSSRQRKFLFEKTLSHYDVSWHGRLAIPKKCAIAHLPPLQKDSAGENLIFWNDRNKMWKMKLSKKKDRHSLQYICMGWVDVVVENRLQCMDVIRFYKVLDENLDDHHHAPHYFLEYKRLNQVQTETTIQGENPVPAVQTKTIRLLGADIYTECKNDCDGEMVNKSIIVKTQGQRHI